LGGLVAWFLITSGGLRLPGSAWRPGGRRAHPPLSRHKEFCGKLDAPACCRQARNSAVSLLFCGWRTPIRHSKWAWMKPENRIFSES